MTVADNAKAITVLQNDYSKIRKTVYGNGDPGMDENVRTIRRDLDKLIKQQENREKKESERLETRERERRLHTWSIIMLVATNLATVIGYAIFWFIRYAPIIEKFSQSQP